MDDIQSDDDDDNEGVMGDDIHLDGRGLVRQP